MTGFQVAVSQFNGGRARYPKKWAFRYDLRSEKSRSDIYTTAHVPISNPLGYCRYDHPCRNNLSLCSDLSHSLVPECLLCGPGSECSFWCDCSHCRLPYLSTNKVQMGTKYGSRLLRRPEIARYVHRHPESATGYRCCGPTNTDTVEIANGEE